MAGRVLQPWRHGLRRGCRRRRCSFLSRSGSTPDGFSHGNEGRHAGMLFSTASEDANRQIRTDTLIVGGGMAGASTAFSLSQQSDASVLLVEAGPSTAPSTGSSYGDSRIYRLMYSDPFFSRMQAVALERWKNLERVSGTQLLHQNGLLFYGLDTGETVQGSVHGAKRAMESLAIPHTYYPNGDGIAASIPALAGCRGKTEFCGVEEATAGYVRASAACRAMIDATNGQCDQLYNSRIVELDLHHGKKHGNAGGYTVLARTQTGRTILARNALIATGAWTNSVLRMANLPLLKLVIWRVQWAHYQVEDLDMLAPIPQAYFFGEDTGGVDGGRYYFFAPSATDELAADGKAYIKIAVDFPCGPVLDSMDGFDYRGDPEVSALMDRFIQEHLQGVGKRVEERCSPYTMTSDDYFVIDKIANNCALFSAGNGRAFKFAPLIGDCLAALLLDKEPPIDLSKFSAKRPAVARA